MSKIRIFQFPFADSNSGVKHYAINNWFMLDKNKFSCDIGTVRKHLDFENEVLMSGMGVKYISCTAENDEEKFIFEMTKILSGNYDVIHLHTSFWKSFLVEKIAIDCKIPKIIVHSHSTKVDIEDESKRIQAEKLHEVRKKEFSTSLATDFCACSKAAADWLFGTQIPRERIKILNNAIDVEKFVFNKSIREKYRYKLGLKDSFVIGHVGRMAYQKNHEFLLNVFAELRKMVKNSKLLLIGDGPLEESIKKQAELLNIKDNIVFTGSRNDVNNLMQAMDVFCLPSWFEGLPISLIEAQTSGLECIGSNKITDEVCISNNIRLLPLEIHRWLDRIVEISKGYERKNMYDIITDSGYNIRNHIKEVEKLYML